VSSHQGPDLILDSLQRAGQLDQETGVLADGLSHRGQASTDRIGSGLAQRPAGALPVHASWLDQIEIYFSIP
jgi:hypothetical protein